MSTTPAAPNPAEPAARQVFATTHWSLVLTATRSDSTSAHVALSHLCAAYWYPLYAYVRRRGHSPQDAQDLTQEFFARLLEKNWLAQADRDRGRFRTFLLSALNHFLANEWDRAHAQKRGGTVQPIPLQLDTAETRYGQEPPDPATPEQIYERRWALALLDAVLNRLFEENRSDGKATFFEMLKPCLVGDREAQPYAALAAQLKMTEGAVKVAVHRLRRRYRQLLREEIAGTVESPGEIDGEMRHLLATLSR
jgi:RNA polymerase sigma-70 factor (ECF subfamily)